MAYSSLHGAFNILCCCSFIVLTNHQLAAYALRNKLPTTLRLPLTTTVSFSDSKANSNQPELMETNHLLGKKSILFLIGKIIQIKLSLISDKSFKAFQQKSFNRNILFSVQLPVNLKSFSVPLHLKASLQQDG